MHKLNVARCTMLWQGRIMADTAMEAKDTPLQEKLELLATRIGYFGFIFAFLTFIAMIVSWYVDNSKLKDQYSTSSWIIHAVITSVTIIVVAIPEGLVRTYCPYVLPAPTSHPPPFHRHPEHTSVDLGLLPTAVCRLSLVWCGVVWCPSPWPSPFPWPTPRARC
jgi:hypothetical protein